MQLHHLEAATRVEGEVPGKRDPNARRHAGATTPERLVLAPLQERAPDPATLEIWIDGDAPDMETTVLGEPLAQTADDAGVVLGDRATAGAQILPHVFDSLPKRARGRVEIAIRSERHLRQLMDLRRPLGSASHDLHNVVGSHG